MVCNRASLRVPKGKERYPRIMKEHDRQMLWKRKRIHSKQCFMNRQEMERHRRADTSGWRSQALLPINSVIDETFRSMKG